jgi:hypothetical protein
MTIVNISLGIVLFWQFPSAKSAQALRTLHEEVHPDHEQDPHAQRQKTIPKGFSPEDEAEGSERAEYEELNTFFPSRRHLTNRKLLLLLHGSKVCSVFQRKTRSFEGL